MLCLLFIWACVYLVVRPNKDKIIKKSISLQIKPHYWNSTYLLFHMRVEMEKSWLHLWFMLKKIAMPHEQSKKVNAFSHRGTLCPDNVNCCSLCMPHWHSRLGSRLVSRLAFRMAGFSVHSSALLRIWAPMHPLRGAHSCWAQRCCLRNKSSPLFFDWHYIPHLFIPSIMHWLKSVQH